MPIYWKHSAMATESKQARMDAKARAFLACHFADSPRLLKEMTDLWAMYLDLELPNTDFFAEFTNGRKESLAQRTWEMVLAGHLSELGHAIECPNGGPDFKFKLGSTTVWVEAVCPLPVGLPDDWLDPNFSGVRSFPHEAILLRWTTAIDSKWKKLNEYLAKNVVKPGDAYVIAVNGSQLSVFPVSCGISQMPFGVESVFPVGPLAHRIDGVTNKIGPSFISERFHIVNANQAEVPTTSFLNAAYSGVSALIGCAEARPGWTALDLHVVHNPLAAVPLSHGTLGTSDNEWWASPVTDTPSEFDLHRPAKQI